MYFQLGYMTSISCLTTSLPVHVWAQYSIYLSGSLHSNEVKEMLAPSGIFCRHSLNRDKMVQLTEVTLIYC